MENEKTKHPGKILTEHFLIPMHITTQKLSEDIHVPQEYLDAIVNETENISADIALRLGKYFGNGPEYWLKLALEAVADNIKNELAQIPNIGNSSTGRTIEQKEKLEKWIKKIQNSHDFILEMRITNALSKVKAIDFSKPTDEDAMAAVMVGDIEAMRKIANSGYKRWCIREIGMWAFMTPCVDVVKFIVDSGFDINNTIWTSSDYLRQRNPLCQAAKCGHADVVEYLLSVGADVRFTNTRGFTPLHFAAFSHSLETVKLLVDAGADINAFSRKVCQCYLNPIPVIEIMAENVFYDGLKYLIEHGAPLHYPNEQSTLLEAACRFTPRQEGRIYDTVNYILDADPKFYKIRNNYVVPVLNASRSCNIETFRALIKHGIPLNRVPMLTIWGNKLLHPLELIAQNERCTEEQIIETLKLVSEHSLPFSQTHVLNCAVHAEIKSRARVCRFLLDNGCPVNSTWRKNNPLGNEAYSPLHSIASMWTAHYNRAEVFSMLIEAGANVNQETPEGMTPLAYIVKNPNKSDFAEIVDIMHKAGADFNAKTKKGYSILQIAQTNRADHTALELLKKYGAK